jgi:hypothetical protein
MFYAGAAFGQITVGDDDPNRMDNATWEAEAIDPPENLQYMMDRREALLLVDGRPRLDAPGAWTPAVPSAPTSVPRTT